MQRNTPLSVTEAFFRIHLEQRDLEGALACLTEQINWFGTGAFEVVRNKEDARKLLSEEIDSMPGGYTVEIPELTEQMLTPDFGTVFGRVVVEDKENSIRLDCRITTTCIRQGKNFLICSLHMSLAADVQEDKEFYPVRFAEQKLEEYKDSIFNTSVSGGIVCTLAEENYPVRFINEFMLHLLGYSREEFFQVTGGKYAACIFPQDFPAVEAASTKILEQGESYTVKYRLQTKSGQLIWVSDTAKKYVTDDGETMLICLCVDITELVHLQEELQVRNDTVAGIASSFPCGICKSAADAQQTILYANEFYYGIFGYTAEEARQAGFTAVSFVLQPGEQQKMWQETQRHIAQKQYLYELELKERHKSGELLHILARCSYDPQLDQINAAIIDVTFRKKMEEQLRISEEQYRIALKQSNNMLFQYDVAAKTETAAQDAAQYYGLEGLLQNVPESVLEAGLIAEESREDYLNFYRAIQNGAPSGSAVIRRKRGDGQFCWSKGDFTTLFSDSGAPLRAIISVNDVTELREKEIAYQKWQQQLADASPSLNMYYECNLTRDLCDREEGGRITHISNQGITTFTGLVAYTAEHYVPADYRRQYLAFLDRNSLLAAFAGQKREMRQQLLMTPTLKETRWVELSVQMLSDPYSADVKLFMIFKDIHEQKLQELELKNKSETDPLTGAYNRGAFLENVSAILQQADEEQHAIIMLDIDNFKRINDTYGHAFGDTVLTSLVKLCRQMLRSGDLIGRMGGDEFMILMRNIPGYAVVEKRAELLLQLTRNQLSALAPISISMGVGMFPLDGKDFDSLYHFADKALYEAKLQGRDRCVFYGPELYDHAWTPAATPIDQPQALPCPSAETAETRQIIHRNTALLQDQCEEERYRLLFKHSGVVVFEWNLESGAWYADEGFGEYVMGQQDPQALLLNKGDKSAVYAEDLGLLEAFFARLSAGSEREEVVLRLKKTDGSYQWARISALCIRDHTGKLMRAIGTIHKVDVGRANADIQLDALLNYMAGGVLLFEIEETIRPLYISPSYYAMAKTSVDEYADYNNDITQLVYEQDKAYFAETLRQGANTGQLVDIVYRNIFRDGGIGWRHLRAVRIPYESEKYPVLIAVVTDITDLKAKEEALKLEDEEMRVIRDLSSAQTFEVDIVRRALFCSETSVLHNYVPRGWVENMPESVIAYGTIHPDSVDAYRSLYADIFAGVPSGSCAVMVLKNDGAYQLSKLSYRMLYDQDGTPYKAVGLSEDIENVNDSRLLFDQEQHLMAMEGKEIYRAFSVNLTKDLLQGCYADGKLVNYAEEQPSYESVLSHILEDIPNADERSVLANELSRDGLRRAYQKGRNHLYHEFRYSDSVGKITWKSHITHLLASPYNGDLYAFIYIRQIDDRKKLELSLPQKVERDSGTFLYNRETMRVLVTEILASQQRRGGFCAMVALRFNYYEQIKSQYSQKVMEEMLFSISRKLRMVLGSRYLISRISDDTVAFFSATLSSSQMVAADIDNLLSVLRKPALFVSLGEQYISFSAGAAQDDAVNTDFDKLLAGALSALHQTTPLNAVILSNRQEAVEKGNLIEFSRNTTDWAFLDKLSQDERFVVETYLYCTRTLLTAEDTAGAISKILGMIGDFYGADWCHVLAVKDGKSLEKSYEWQGEGLGVVDMPELLLEHTKSFTRGYQMQESFMLHDISALSSQSEGYQLLLKLGVHAIYAVPMVYSGTVTGFITVANPKRNKGKLVLLQSLSSFLASETTRRKAIERQNYMSRHDLLTGVLSRNSYAEFLMTVNPETLSSVGVAMVDIFNLQKLNSVYGNQYGDSALLHTAQILQKHFGADVVYRYAGGTFLVLCRDITHDTFTAQVNAVREEFDVIVHFDVAVGATWTDVVSSIDKLVLESAELMSGAKREATARLNAKHDAHRSVILQDLQDSIKNAHTKIYLQPKATVMDDRICGAEALIRIVHPKQGVIYPGAFVPLLEELGLIRYVDFFVLESVCRVLEQWQQKGYSLFPISLNFSRATLLEPGVVQSIEAVTNRYAVPRRLIEIEITESMGDFAQETIANIAKNIRNAGFRLSLDDFGAKYSNLSILSAIHFSALKLDKSLADRVLSNKMACSIVKSVSALCAEYDVEVIAEGVETKAQRQKIGELGCGYVQGYIINKPIPTGEFETLYLKA